MLVYPSSPYAHNDSRVMAERFVKAAELVCKLADHHIPAFSSVVTYSAIGYKVDAEWDWWEPLDDNAIASCDVVLLYTLDGWTDSVGVNEELQIAARYHKPVVVVPPIEVDDKQLFSDVVSVIRAVASINGYQSRSGDNQQ